MTDERDRPVFDSETFQEQLKQHVKDSGGTAKIGGHDFVQKLVQQTYQALLDAEMDEHLGYPKHSPEGRNGGDSRNGKLVKTVKGDFGQIEIATPRDRDGDFEPQIIKKRQTSVPGFLDKIVSLYARGMTNREIEMHLKEMYGVDVSPAFVTRATEKVMEEVVDWQNRSLEKLYAVVYMDGIRYNVRDEGRIQKKVVYICLGLTIDGKQDVLGLWIAASEGAAYWMNICNELKARGVEDILIACVDGLNGLPEAIEAVFPKVDVQECIVHQIRNSTKFISHKDRKAFCKDLKAVYAAPSLAAAEQGLVSLEEKWSSKYPGSIKSWKANWNRLSTFFKYPVELRKIIYTTNSIESLNSQLRKNTNRKIFPSDDAVLKILYLNIRNITKKWSFKQNWDIVVNQLAILFEDRFTLDALS